ncbi:hypothetical protein RDI58_000987 [Solanum bulbocastanum]|uniref:DUF4216 domain-containing protein n=1 Tax=Solanum bulbocastanum TaxID=147425 RepID=A0AAN8YMS9_SOLBU
MCSKTEDSLRWHEEERSKEGRLRHPTDGLSWKDFDRLHPDFVLDCRNNISGKTKDYVKSRYDLKDMGIRKNLPPKDTEDNKRAKFAKVCFSMTNGDKSIFCAVLKIAKLPDGSASNISREHEQEVNNQSRRSKWSKAKNHCQNFSQWFETRALEEDVPNLIKQLSRGPNFVVERYSGYLINGYRFHVRQRDARRKTQNSGVTVVASTTSFASSKDKNLIATYLTYYGKIVDIVELYYYDHFKVLLFKGYWYEVENDTYGLTYVYFNKRYSQEEPFVLGSQVHQCFYVQDLYDQDRHYVMKTIPRDLFNMGKENKEIKKSGKNESISNAKERGSESKQSSKSIEESGFDMQYRSSAELANKLNIKREQLANEHNDRAKKE